MNLGAWSSVPEPSGDSSILKIQAFLGRLKTITPQNADALSADVKRFKLVKYQTEICDGMTASAARAKSAADVAALVQIQSALHQTIGAPYSLLSVPRLLKTVQATGRQKTLARLTLDFYFEDLLPPASSKVLVNKMLSKLEPSGSTLKVLLGYPLDDIVLEYVERVEVWIEESEPPQITQMMLSDEILRIQDKRQELIEAAKLCLEARGHGAGAETDNELIGGAYKPQGQAGPVPAPASAPEAPAVGAAADSKEPPKWSQYEHKLTTMSSPQLVDTAVAEFSSDPSTFTKTQTLLLEAPRTHMIQWYALYLAGIPELAVKVSPTIVSRYESPTYLRYAAELVKVGVLGPEAAVDILIKLSTPVLKPSLCFTFSEACGDFLVQCQEVAPRLASYRDFLRKQPATAQDRTLIDGTIEYLSETSTRHIAEERSVTAFMRLVLYRELNRSTYPRVLKLVKKLRQQELLGVHGLFCDLRAISSENTPLIAKLVVQLASFSPEFGLRVLNTLVDGLQAEKQLQVGYAMMLGELRPLLLPTVIKHVFQGFLDTPGVAYRLKLASIFVLHTGGLGAEFLATLKEYRAGVVLEAGSEITALYERAVSVCATHGPGLEAGAENEADADPEAEPEAEADVDGDSVEPEEEYEPDEPDDPVDDLEPEEDAEFMAAFQQAQTTQPAVPNLSSAPAAKAPKGLLNIAKLKGLAL